MRVEVIDFPSDPYCELGDLRKHLVKALQRADVSVDAAKLLASTLGFTASKLREVYKEDGIKSKGAISREKKAEKARLKAEKAATESTRLAVKAARSKLQKEKNPQLLSEMKKVKKKK